MDIFENVAKRIVLFSSVISCSFAIATTDAWAGDPSPSGAKDQVENDLSLEAKKVLQRSNFDNPKIIVSRRLRELGVRAEMRPSRAAIHNAWERQDWNELSLLVNCGEPLKSREQIDCILRSLDSAAAYLTLTDAVRRPQLNEKYEFYVVQIDKTPAGPITRTDPQFPKWQVHPDGHGFIRKITNFPEYEREFIVLLVAQSEMPVVNQIANPFPPGARYGQNETLRDVEMKKIDQRKELGLITAGEAIAAKIQFNDQLASTSLGLADKY